MTASDGWVLVLAIFPVIYVSHFLHELGHALCTRLAGLKVGSFGMGLGRPFWVGRWFGSKVFLCRDRPFQGLCFMIFSELDTHRWQKVLAFSGGILAHLALTAGALVLCYLYPGQVLWQLIAAVNALNFLVNLLPFTVSIGNVHYRSDGAHILAILARNYTRIPSGQALQALRQLRPLWEAIDDRRSLQTFLFGAAAVWYDLGDPEYSSRLADEAEDILPGKQTLNTAVFTALRGLSLAKQGSAEQALVALEEAETQMKKAGRPAGQLILDLFRGLVLHYLHQSDQAVEQLEALAASPLLAQRFRLRIALLEARIQVLCAVSDAKKLAPLRAEYEAIPARLRPDTTERDVYRSLGRFLLAQGAEDEAHRAFQRALAAVRSLDKSLIDPEDRERFRLAQADLLAEIQGSLQALGKTAEAEEVARFFAASDQTEARQLDEQTRRARRLLRWGIGAWLVNLCVVLIVLGTSDFIEDLSKLTIKDAIRGLGVFKFLFVFVQSFAGLLTLIHGLVVWRLGKSQPRLRLRLGRNLLLLAAVTWLTWLVVALLILFEQ